MLCFVFRARNCGGPRRRSNGTIVDNAFHCMETRSPPQLCAAWLIPVIAESAFIAAATVNQLAISQMEDTFTLRLANGTLANVFFAIFSRASFPRASITISRVTIPEQRVDESLACRENCLARERNFLQIQFVKRVRIRSNSWYKFRKLAGICSSSV